MPSFETEFGAISYGVNGVPARKDGLALLLVHGAGGQRADWPRSWQNPTGDFATLPTYAVDLPGHGKSLAPACDSVSDFADRIEAFIEAMPEERVIVLGHSMGAAIAMDLGTRDIAKIAGLVFVAGGAEYFVHPKMLAGFLSHFHATVDSIVNFSWPDNARESYKRQQKWHMLAAGPQIVHDDFLACSTFKFSDRLRDISKPVLTVASENDRMVLFKASNAVHDTVPNSKLVSFKNCGHFLHVEKQKQVADAVLLFADGLTS